MENAFFLKLGSYVAAWFKSTWHSQVFKGGPLISEVAAEWAPSRLCKRLHHLPLFMMTEMSSEDPVVEWISFSNRDQ